MLILAFCLFLGLLLLFAIRRGGQPEKYVAYVFVLAFVWGLLTLLLLGPSNYQQFDIARFGIELSVLIVVTGVAIRANRWWPICISALQLIIVVTQLLKLTAIRGSFGIYWAMTTVPTYLQYLVLLVGICTHVFRMRKHGKYRDWRQV